ncbi:hypothetical protein JNW91_04975 [Micromonospora sp. STR1_7]|uniref:DUF2892 domain-containing protein n=1 Tax=Micromonospora parastrephiae TaxID=2806101 RepID=A0ABS1XPS4_9ACTN|nr:hypothetical protein [Micromonospora parastrephiae]MBM0231280.1 hypothetical protein [Micromonospora parastrephiae]
MTPIDTVTRTRPERTDLPGLHRLRVVLLVFVLLAITGAGGHAPPWTRLVLAATAAAVPAAIAVQYGWSTVRTLLGMPSRPDSRGGAVSAGDPIRSE